MSRECGRNPLPLCTEPETLDLAAVRARLKGKTGPDYWRSLEELAETESFREFLHREFPRFASEWPEGMSRRRFLALMAASLALAGVNGCASSLPPEKIVPYVRAPENVVPGKPLFYATAFPLGGYVQGVLVESHLGRPTKIEGNLQHPASLGATSAFAQASILDLYDPDRSQTVTYRGRIRGWADAVNDLRQQLERQRPKGGAGLRILTETVTSTTLAAQLRTLLTKDFPQARWCVHEPVGRENARAGARLAFGTEVQPIYHLKAADVIVSLDADFLGTGPGQLRYTHDFSKRRVDDKPSRLYVVEATPSITGAAADHRRPMRASQVERHAFQLAAELGVASPPSTGVILGNDDRKWFSAIVDDLKHHAGSSLVMAGDQQPATVHAFAHAMNQALGNVGTTVTYIEPVEASLPDHQQTLAELVRDMAEGKVEALLVLGGNPAYTAPADLRFVRQLANVPFRLHLGLYEDETSQHCHWHIPETHYLEAWSDGRAFDGTATIMQPLIAPLYGGKSAHEVIAACSDQPDRTGYDIVRDRWQPGAPGPADFERLWEKAVHDGSVPNSAAPPKVVKAAAPAGADFSDLLKEKPPRLEETKDESPLEIVFRPDPTLYDGRFANNGWLQELPKPLTKLTWDNAALLSPATAERLKLSHRIGRRGGQHGEAIVDILELTYGGRTVHAPAWIMPGHADDSITVYLGHGRARAGKVGLGTGFNAYRLRASDKPWFDTGLEIARTRRTYKLACTQQHHLLEGRNLLGLDEPAEQHGHGKHALPTLYPEVKYEGYKWGMVIDLAACTGCSACVVACQAENNIPVVGKEQVLRGREMHWLRIDTYYKGELDNPETYFQPLLCQQCENAPCELVCPVAATVHSDEGLNDMVYNRCVGTRYCSHNCPYKVRRFNFFQYADYATESLKLLRNPDVTVRSRGVMEKCTYCVQRINSARIEASKGGRLIRDGEVLTACQAACPAQAIVFGNLNDPKSQVKQHADDERNFSLLEELNTRPRTTYLRPRKNRNANL